MAKQGKQFLCTSCGAVQPRWMGKCPDCGQWDSLEEYRLPDASAKKDEQRGVAVATGIDGGEAPVAQPINDVSEAIYRRLPTTIGELDRVLGGQQSENESLDGGEQAGSEEGGIAIDQDPDRGVCGIVPGSAVLVGGDPGIGKSTLLLQAAHKLCQSGQRVLYVTSEESAQQTRLRAARIGVSHDDLFVLADTNLARIVEQIRSVDPAVVVMDSIQMIYKGDLPAAPGSVTQLRACCTELVYLAKATGIAIMLVGHVTKDGKLAGPRMLEHLVDTVLYFEGDRYHSHRIIRAIKNRFGNTLEVGLFEMSDAGMREVRDGSSMLAAEYRPMPGSVVCPVLQGSRCLLVEIQALTATGFLGSAKRKTTGVDGSRLAMLIAVLEKRAELRLADQDIFASSIGGVKIVEPAADLAVALAITGAHYNRQLEPGVCAVGEIGLGGEIRHVQGMAQRLTEAARLGFKRIIGPNVGIDAPKGAELIAVNSLNEAVGLLG